MAQRPKIGATPTTRKQTGKGSNGLCPRPSRPALRGGVTGGEPPLYPAPKSNLLHCPDPTSALPLKPFPLDVSGRQNGPSTWAKTADPHNRPTAGQHRASFPRRGTDATRPAGGPQKPSRGQTRWDRARAVPQAQDSPLSVVTWSARAGRFPAFLGRRYPVPQGDPA